ncbi:MAG: hypothetical protein LBH59_06005 [Planctomycetaceae bacterium]|nr:hypothetical protein [Planctomycetaceae bacterium]
MVITTTTHRKINVFFIFNTSGKKLYAQVNLHRIPKPVWAIGFALEQTLHVVALAMFSFANFKTDSA